MKRKRGEKKRKLLSIRNEKFWKEEISDNLTDINCGPTTEINKLKKENNWFSCGKNKSSQIKVFKYFRNFEVFVKQKKNEKNEKIEKTEKIEKIRLYPNIQQKKIFHQWFNASKLTYNLSLDYINRNKNLRNIYFDRYVKFKKMYCKKYMNSDFKYNFLKFQKEIMNNKVKNELIISEEKMLNENSKNIKKLLSEKFVLKNGKGIKNKKYLLFTPKCIRRGAISDLIKNLKIYGEIKKFRSVFDYFQLINIKKKNYNSDGRLGFIKNLKSVYQLPKKIYNNAMLAKDSLNRFYIIFKKIENKKKIEKKEKKIEKKEKKIDKKEKKIDKFDFYDLNESLKDYDNKKKKIKFKKKRDRIISFDPGLKTCCKIKKKN
jgi:hypothetical protein